MCLGSLPADEANFRAMVAAVNLFVSPKTNVEFVHILEELAEPFNADELSQVSPDLAIPVDGELAVAEAAAARKTGGKGAGLAVGAHSGRALGAFTLFDGLTLLDHQYACTRIILADLVSGENAAGTGADDDHIIGGTGRVGQGFLDNTEFMPFLL